jgi:O-antigen/teichoic acid export membrane protein
LIKRLIKGFTANFYGQITNSIVQIFGVPIFLVHWGIGYYGEWLLISSLATYFSMTDLGFGRVAANEMTIQVARNNYKNALEVFQGVSFILFIFITIIFTILGIILYFIPITTVFALKLLSRNDASFTIVILLFYVLFYIQTGILEAGFRCDNNFAIGSFIINTIRFFEQVIVIIIVILNKNIIVASIAMTTIRIVGFFLSYLYLKKLSPWLKFKYSIKNINDIKRLFIPSLAYAAIPIGNVISMQGINVIVGTILGPVLLVAFTTTRTLINVVKQFMNLINYTVWPEFSKLFGEGKVNLAKELNRYTFQITFWISAILVVILFIYGERIFLIWTHYEVSYYKSFFIVMLISTFTYNIWTTSSVVPIASNHHNIIGILSFFSSLTILIINILLLPIFNLIILPITFIIMDIMMITVVTNISLRLLDDNVLDFIYAVFDFRTLVNKIVSLIRTA